MSAYAEIDIAAVQAAGVAAGDLAYFGSSADGNTVKQVLLEISA